VFHDFMLLSHDIMYYVNKIIDLSTNKLIYQTQCKLPKTNTSRKCKIIAY